MKNLLLTLTFVMSYVASSQTALAVDLGEIQTKLTTTGVKGWVHGAAAEQGLYVFTYRNPTNFFDYLIMSLVPASADVDKQLKTLGRNDEILVRGKFLSNPSPQKHISVASIEIVKKFDPGMNSDNYSYEAKIPDDLIHQNKATFLVHAIGGDGHILVLEYKDAVVPVYAKDATQCKSLYRNDVVELQYKIQAEPDRPVHLNLDSTAAQPIKVMDSIAAKNGKAAEVEGALILFPKSPEIIFNVFAVQEELGSGLKRQYTLVNFDSPEAFKKIRELLQQAWDKYPNAYVNGRNKYVSQKIRVKAVGTFNEIDPSQANAQILLKSADSLQIIEH